MKIICIGRNYAAHVRELGNEPGEPVLFMKPESAVLRKGNPFFIPAFSNDVHYEAEIVVKISKLGKNISERFAHRYYNEITIGIDFTARDVQNNQKAKGLPWEIAKAFDGSAAIGKFIPVKDLADVKKISFRLDKNNKTVQQGNSDRMIWNIDKMISHVSKYFTLKTGDFLFTGTPEGVGPVKEGDKLEGFIGNRKLLSVNIK
jgi:2-keto-4-pentenoate hydratase/2-oxohepta-3-ene-1,7-dioic acid hydratase in catechol pathway